MKIRKLPFGYCIRNGKVCIHERDADTVRMIFRRYSQGASYAQVADALKRQNVPYIPEKGWNKNVVARILQDGRYLGDGTYPQLLPQETFHAAQAAMPRAGASPEEQRLVKNLRALVRCSFCGGSMVRNFRNNWRCPDCMPASVKVTDATLKLAVTELLDRLADSIPDIGIPEASYNPAIVHGLELELEQAMNQDDFDEDTAKAQVVALAAARFHALGSEDYETMRLKYRLSHKEQDGELDAGLLFDITAAVLLHPTGAVSLWLKNGQIVERKCET